MPKNLATTDAQCPQCGDDGEKLPRMDVRAASNVTVLRCLTCEWEFAKDQSVKIPGNLVRHAAEAMHIHEGYSSLGEYVRDCIRRMNEVIFQRYSSGQFSEFMEFVANNPNEVKQMLTLSQEDVGEFAKQPVAKEMYNPEDV